MKRTWVSFVIGALVCGALVCGAPAAVRAQHTEVTLPCQKVTLDNGLTVILHEDHTVPRVVVDVLWDVGSRNEVPGRTGFAHLFEHLMFTGTRRAPNHSFDTWMEQEGAYNNASTSQDVTEYHDVGPSHVLPLLLWLEADRAADFGNGITQEKLDAQRDVVRNERRQTSENTPYGVVELTLPELLYPPEHPYHHEVIGSHEDLAAASVADVKAFFAKYYDVSRASLVVAGDFDPAATLALVRKYFGGIPSRITRGERVVPEKADVPAYVGPLTRVVRATVEDRVELPKVLMVWRVPQELAPGTAELEVLSRILGDGKASRLYKRLVYEKKLAQSVDVGLEDGRLGSSFLVDAIARPGVSLDALERAIDEELERVRRAPPTAEELQRARNGLAFGATRGLEPLLGRALVLNRSQWRAGDPGHFAKRLAELQAVPGPALQKAAAELLPAGGRVILRVVPAKEGPTQEKEGAR